MTGTSNRPLNPFRKQNSISSSQPLHSRWGDVAITVPTEGSRSQYKNPSSRSRSHKKEDYESGYIPEHSTRRHHRHVSFEDEDTDFTASTDTRTSSRRDSLLSSTFSSPRHISISRSLSFRRRPSLSIPETEGRFEEKENLITERRNDFAYKPIKPDYAAEVAEYQSNSQLHRANTTARFRYIPASSRYREEFGEMPLRNRSMSSPGSDQGGGRILPRRSSGKRISIASSSSSSSSKYLTTDMVPDLEDLYG